MANDKRTRIHRRLLQNSSEYLRDEAPLALFRGQTSISPLVLPLIGPLLVKLVHPRAVIVTDKSVVTVQQSAWSQSGVRGLVSRYSRSVPIELSRWGLKIGEDEKIFALPSTFPDMREVARLVGSVAV